MKRLAYLSWVWSYLMSTLIVLEASKTESLMTKFENVSNALKQEKKTNTIDTIDTIHLPYTSY